MGCWSVSSCHYLPDLFEKVIDAMGRRSLGPGCVRVVRVRGADDQEIRLIVPARLDDPQFLFTIDFGFHRFVLLDLGVFVCITLIGHDLK